jgi:hypothetical protein
MSAEFEQPQQLTAVEQTLAAVAPAPPRVDRDRLMFLAGIASAQGQKPAEIGLPPRIGRTWLWPAATAALGATSLALAIALLVRPAPPTQIVHVERQAARGEIAAAPRFPAEIQPAHRRSPVAPAAVPADNYVRAREVALRLGLDALGVGSRGNSADDSPVPTYRSLLESFAPAGQNQPGAGPQTSQM